jgi:prepilin-type processing-associated H-X9-DG protein
MKQIALGVLMYAQDNDGAVFPYKYQSSSNPDGSEMRVLLPYTKATQIFQCPSSKQKYNGTSVNCTTNPTHWYCASYGFPAVHVSNNHKAILMNVAFGGTTIIMDAIPLPAQTCMLAETRGGFDVTNTWGYTRFNATDLSSSGFDGLVVPDRHFGGSNYAFVDGHVKWLKAETALAPRAQNQAIRFYWLNSENP